MIAFNRHLMKSSFPSFPYVDWIRGNSILNWQKGVKCFISLQCQCVYVCVCTLHTTRSKLFTLQPSVNFSAGCHLFSNRGRLSPNPWHHANHRLLNKFPWDFRGVCTKAWTFDKHDRINRAPYWSIQQQMLLMRIYSV